LQSRKIVIQLQESMQGQKISSQIIMDNQNFLPKVFEYIIWIYSARGQFDETFFYRLLLEIEEGFR
jgi:hypothetical protein